MQHQLEQAERELRIRNYSPKTIKIYLYGLREYFVFKQLDLEHCSTDNIKNFLLCCEKNTVSAQTRNLFLSAIKFYYHHVMNVPDTIQIHSAKKNISLPVVLSRNEIDALIQATTNRKHKLLLSLSYGSGLRVSEAVNLKIQDVDMNELTIHNKFPTGLRPGF